MLLIQIPTQTNQTAVWISWLMWKIGLTCSGVAGYYMSAPCFPLAKEAFLYGHLHVTFSALLCITKYA